MTPFQKLQVGQNSIQKGVWPFTGFRVGCTKTCGGVLETRVPYTTCEIALTVISPEQYIGETGRSIKERFLEHKGYVSNKMLTKATGAHFNQRGHSISDMQITIIEKVFNPDPQFWKQREKMFINKFNTRYKGINKSSGGWKNC